MTGPRLGPRTHNARAPARHSSHSDETTRLYNALQQFFRTSPNPRNIAVRRVLRLPQSFNIIAEFHDAQLVSALSAARKTAQVAAPRRRAAAGRDGRIVEPFPARAEDRSWAAKAWRRSLSLVRAQQERSTSLPACGFSPLPAGMEEENFRESFPFQRRRRHCREPPGGKIWVLSLVLAGKEPRPVSAPAPPVSRAHRLTRGGCRRF